MPTSSRARLLSPPLPAPASSRCLLPAAASTSVAAFAPGRLSGLGRLLRRQPPGHHPRPPIQMMVVPSKSRPAS
ncbi:hypothetical protein E2562_000451 [Oryza meyeriana var. granulata]|uniref:Uncharacterized protein n=1 Tax=Oryza meyeriana var. granulata TaxID=110450 RepID=A0A6G1CC12_9ORYZ|nr:hypothetical protein E2562_000451 [Oryza meyeriana var. granulata]